MNVTLAQLVLAVSIPTMVALMGILFNVILSNRLSGRIDAKIDRQTENFNNQVTTLLSTVHNVDVRVVRLEEKAKD